jgi:hypothetical protein
MKKIIVFLILPIIFSCNRNQNCNEKIRNTETIQIIQTISGEGVSLPICTNLKKLNIRTDLQETQKNSEPSKIISVPIKEKSIFQNTEIMIEKILWAKYNGKRFFNKKDSLNFVQQNHCLENYRIPKDTLKRINTISLATLENKKSHHNFVILSTPIFSSNNKKAYVEIDTYSKERHGESIYLEKIENKWKVIFIDRNWYAD